MNSSFEKNNYIGSGELGSTFFATDKRTNENRVLKLIECKDESTANKAFYEYESIANLNHPYINPIRDLFVYWNDDHSSVMLGLISDSCHHGNLLNIFENANTSKEPISISSIKRWLGEILEALIYAKEMQLIHGNLKPQNLFLTKNAGLVVSDFGNSILLNDRNLRVKRFKIDDRYWLSPEKSDNLILNHDHSCDVYSIGAILFSLLTAHQIDANDRIDLLQILHESPRSNNTTERISKLLDNRSDSLPELNGIIIQMLHENPEKRLKFENLTSLNFIQKCLQSTNSADLERFRRQQITSDDRPLPESLNSLSNDQNGVITFKALNDSITYMKNQIDNELCVETCLTLLFQKTQLHVLLDTKKEDEDFSDNQIVKSWPGDLCEIIHENRFSENISYMGLEILSRLLMSNSQLIDLDSSLFLKSSLAFICDIFKYHANSFRINQVAIFTLGLFSNDEASLEILKNINIFEKIESRIRYFLNNLNIKDNSSNNFVAVMSTILLSVWKLSITKKMKASANDAGLFTTICQLLSDYYKDPVLVQNSSICLYALYDLKQNQEILENYNIFWYLLISLYAHIRFSNTLKSVLNFISLLISNSEENGLMFIECEHEINNKSQKMNGMHIIKFIFQNHKDDVDVMESLVAVIESLIKYDDLLGEASTDDFLEWIKELRKKFIRHAKILSVCDETISRINYINEMIE